MAAISIGPKEELIQRFTDPVNQELEIRFFNIDYPGFHNTGKFPFIFLTKTDYAQIQKMTVDYLDGVMKSFKSYKSAGFWGESKVSLSIYIYII